MQYWFVKTEVFYECDLSQNTSQTQAVDKHLTIPSSSSAMLLGTANVAK